MLYKIEYTVSGSYTPFLIILRDANTNLMVDSKVKQQTGVDEFINLPYGTYIVEVYDSATGMTESGEKTPTTTTIAP